MNSKKAYELEHGTDIRPAHEGKSMYEIISEVRKEKFERTKYIWLLDYEDYNDWSVRAVEEITHGNNVWVDPCLWDDMEYDFNHELEGWWPDIYEEFFEQYKEELLDSGEYKLEEDE